jgi:hypothetical protein
MGFETVCIQLISTRIKDTMQATVLMKCRLIHGFSNCNRCVANSCAEGQGTMDQEFERKQRFPATCGTADKGRASLREATICDFI